MTQSPNEKEPVSRDPPVAAHRPDEKQQVIGYEDYEAAFVDEAFVADMSSPLYQLSASQSVVSPLVPARKAEAVSSPEQVDFFADTTKSVDFDPELESQDSAFLAKVSSF